MQKYLFNIFQYYIILLVFFIPKDIRAQSLSHSLDSMIQTLIPDDNGPGGVFMVAKDGNPIYQKAYGRANLELESSMYNGSVFQIGSMTKQFTAIAILMLEAQGKLSVHDSISKYVPDFINGQYITIHHLLSHTSGIKDFTKMKSIQDIALCNMTPTMIIDIFKNEPPNFFPGEKFEYCNSGYVILGHIIELTSSMSYQSFIEQYIFKALGMEHSYYATDEIIIPHRASGYHKRANGYVNKTTINYSVPYASGALMSTVEDMLIWQNALNRNLFLDESYIQKAFTKAKLRNGETINYGYGWHLKEINNTDVREHGGSIFGFKSMAVYISEKDIYVIGLTNCDCLSPTQLVRDIAVKTLKHYEE